MPSSEECSFVEDRVRHDDFVLVALGMNLFDDCDLDAVGEAAAARKCWEFLLTAAPLPKGTGSPINPTALF